MAILKIKAPDVMRAAAGFRLNDTGRKPIQRTQQLMSPEAFVKYERSCFVQPGKTENGLPQIYF